VILVLGIRAVIGTVISGVGMTAGSVVFVELLGAIRAFEFMAFAGNTGENESREEHGRKFHRGAT
jgi:hypothetical protein